MSVKTVLRFPHPLLKTKCSPFEEFAELASSTARDLIDTMRVHPRCVGLAAPQIGVSKRMIVVDVSGHPKATVSNGMLVLANPTVSRLTGFEIAREGCLSLPEITADVRRAVRIRVEALTAEGSRVDFETEGFEARAIQHEIDHLDGILILDRVSSPSEIFKRRSSHS